MLYGILPKWRMCLVPWSNSRSSLFQRRKLYLGRVLRRNGGGLLRFAGIPGDLRWRRSLLLYGGRLFYRTIASLRFQYVSLGEVGGFRLTSLID